MEQKDPVLAHGLASRVKYVRLVRRKIRGEKSFLCPADLRRGALSEAEECAGRGHRWAGSGTLHHCHRRRPRRPRCSHSAPELARDDRVVRREERHLDRQRRANNPDNYLPNGRVKPGRKGRKHWRESVRQRKTQAHLADRQRRLAGPSQESARPAGASSASAGQRRSAGKGLVSRGNGATADPFSVMPLGCL